MDARLVALDLDGTLLRSDGTISRFSRRTIQEATRAGIHVVIATGRARDVTERIVRWLGLTTPIVCCNGARVFSEKRRGSRELWASVPVGEEEATGVISMLRQLNVYFHVHLDDTVAVEEGNLGRVPEERVRLRRLLWTPLGGYTRVRPRVLPDGSTERYASHILKICCDGPEDAVKHVEEMLGHGFAQSLRWVRTGKTFLEIMNKRVNKGEALSMVASRMGVPLSQVVAIGDGDNDIEMITNAGMGVAVANGSPLLCLQASHVAFSNDDDGPAWFVADLLRQRRKEECGSL